MRRAARLFSVTLLGLLITAGLGLSGLGPTASAEHDTISWSRYWPSSPDSRHQFFHLVFTDQQGGLYFFQFDQHASNGQTNVTVAKYVTRGPTGNPERQFVSVVNPTIPNIVWVGNPYGYVAPPSAAMDHNSDLYVAWGDSFWRIWVSKSSDGGLTWDAPTRVDSETPDYNDYVPAIVAVPNGDLYVVWLQIWGPGNLRSLAVARSTDAGLTWGARTNITSGADYYTHRLAADSVGGLHLVYSTFVSPNLRANYTRSDDGTTWATAIPLGGGSLTFQPTVAVDASNRVHLLWYDARQSPSGSPTYWYRRSDDRGVTWTMEVPVSQGRYPTGGGIIPTLAVHGDTVIAGWPAFVGAPGMAYATSPDGGNLWHPERAAEFGAPANYVTLAADEIGTFYAGFYYFGFAGNADLGYSIWDGPPSVPTITGIVRGTGRLTVSWSGSPEGDVAGYRLWRSSDGVAYELAGTFDSTTGSYVDSGLANGVYWYRVTSFDIRGTASHPSASMFASVGQSVAEELADLKDQLASLENESSSEADALRGRINDLERQLSATQGQSLLNTILLVIVILLLVFMFLQSRRRSMMAPQMPVPPTAPSPPTTSSWQPPPTPPTPPQPSKSPESRFPEEEL